MTTKKELRSQTLEARATLDPAVRALRDRLIFQRAHKDRVFQLASLVHVYRNSEYEVETHMFIEYAWGIGKEVAVPRVISDTHFESVLVTRSTTWERDQFGILYPVDGDVVPNSQFNKNNAAIVPLVCFDQQRNRIGYGKGYYDRFLVESDIHSVGIAYELQKVKHVPIEPHDLPLDRIATEERWY